MNIYVGNLSYDATEEDVRKAFEAFGQVTSVSLITDKYSGDSKGFGFVEMAEKSEGQKAIDGLNGKEFMGRTVTVNEARPRPERSGNRGGFGGGGGGGGRGGGRGGGGGGGGRSGGGGGGGRSGGGGGGRRRF